MNPIAKYGSALGMILAGILSLLVGQGIITEDTAYNIAGAIFSITGGAVAVTKYGSRMPMIALLLLGIAGAALAAPRTPNVAGGGPFYVETFFDEYQKPTQTPSFTYTENGVTVTFTANAGTLLREGGVICPSDPDAGLSATFSQPVDQFYFDGPRLAGDVFLIAHCRTAKGGTWLQFVNWVVIDPKVYGFFYKNNSLTGFTVTNACLDMLRLDEHAR